MKIYTADIEMTQPANKAVHAPLNSKYGIGLKFTEDGVPKTFAEDEVKMDGQTADNVVDGMFVYMRESGSQPSGTVHDVEAGSPALEVSAEGNVGTMLLSPRQVRFAGSNVYLSAVIDSPVEVTYDQLLIYRRSSISTSIEDEEYECLNYKPTWDGSIDVNTYINVEGGTQSPTTYLWPAVRKFARSEDGSWKFYDAITVKPSTIVFSRASGKGSGTLSVQAKVDIDVPSKIKHYKVTEIAEDQGVAIGYDEIPVLSAITLSGSYDDDTAFSYTLPITD